MNAPPFRRSYALGDVYAVEFTVDGQTLTAAWSPQIPDRETGRALLPAYLAAIEDYVAWLGGDAVLVVGV
jgi:hypothetical protein